MSEHCCGCLLRRFPSSDALCGGDLFFDELDLSRVDEILDTYFTIANMRTHLIASEVSTAALGVCADSAWVGFALQDEHAEMLRSATGSDAIVEWLEERWCVAFRGVPSLATLTAAP